MVVTVEEEGIYGFRMVVENGAGLRGTGPAPGDLPEVWVGVDLSKPRGKLTSAERGTGNQGGELIIRWEASDEQLDGRPVSLFFGENPAGPWLTIAAGLENTGEYAWRLDRRVPDKVFLRLEVRDEAGNIHTSDTAEEISTSPVRPQGHIRDVHPLEEAAHGARRIYNLR